MIHLRLLRLAAPARVAVAATIVMGLVLSALAITQAVSTARVFAGIVTGESLSTLVVPLIVLAAALLARPLATAGREIAAHAAASRAKTKLRAQMLDATAAAGPITAGVQRAGEADSLLVDGVENIEPYVARYIPQVVVTAVTAVCVIAFLTVIDPVVGLVAAAAAIAVLAVPRLWDAALQRRGDDHWGAYSGLHADTVDAMRGMETLKLLGATRRTRRRLHAAGENLLTATLAQLRLSLVESGLTGFLLLAGPAIVLCVAVVRVNAGALPASALFLVTMLSFEAYRPFRDLANHWHAGYLGVSAGGRILNELDRAQDSAAAHPDSRAGAAAPYAVELENVVARYPGADTDALSDVSLRIREGNRVAIVGASGSGKSTIANILLGFLTPTSGRVAVQKTAPGMAIALVSQDPVIFSGTVRDNLAVIAPEADDARLLEALEKAQALELASIDRGGLDAPVGDTGALLSGGQRQRLAVARALLLDAPILLLDEATSALDTRRERALLAGLPRHTGDGAPVTTVVVAHRLSSIRDVDEVFVMGEGRVLEHGRYDELVAAGGALAKLDAAQRDEVTA